MLFLVLSLWVSKFMGKKPHRSSFWDSKRLRAAIMLKKENLIKNRFNITVSIII
jgi:hypothetical protein